MAHRSFHRGQHNLIGMIHLQALPGAPEYEGSILKVVDFALREAQILVSAGFDGLMVENFNDAPFFKDQLPPETIAGLARCSHELRLAFPSIPIGVNALRNDSLSALSIAEVTDCDFIRVNVLCGATVTDQGLIEGKAAHLARLKAKLQSSVDVWADLNVKHAQPLVPFDEQQMLADVVNRGKANVVVLSGSGTGQPTNPNEVKRIADMSPVPVAVGSGIDLDNLANYDATHLIVGSSLKTDGTICLNKASEMVRHRNSMVASII